MSDLTADAVHGEKRRILASLAAACVVHGAILGALALGLGVGAILEMPPQVTVELAYSAEPAQDASASDASSGAVVPTGPGASGPVGSTATAAARGAGGPLAAADASGFVIPAPRAQAMESTPAAGPAFREAGGKTGAAQAIPSVPSAAPGAAVPPVQQGKGSGEAAASGAGAAATSSAGVSSTQRAGTGVLVTGSSGSTTGSGGKLDLSKLDQSLAGSAGSAGGKSGAGGAAGGTGGGSAPGTAPGTAGGSGGSGGQGYSVVWGTADSGKGRKPLSTPSPKIPESVSAQGLTLSVTVSFTLLADGLIGGATIQQSSGNAVVDSAVLDAIRRWRFTPAEGAAPATGVIPYVIKTR